MTHVASREKLWNFVEELAEMRKYQVLINFIESKTMDVKISIMLISVHEQTRENDCGKSNC